MENEGLAIVTNAKIVSVAVGEGGGSGRNI
jgi:hypothetical protein